VLQSALHARLISNVDWKELRPGIYLPVAIDLKVSAEEFIDFIAEKVQRHCNVASELLLQLFTTTRRAVIVNDTVIQGAVDLDRAVVCCRIFSLV
jgi:hypothetical protein